MSVDSVKRRSQMYQTLIAHRTSVSHRGRKNIPLLILDGIYRNKIKAFYVLFKTLQGYQNNWRFP